jgi:hypothetical protein
MSSAALFGGDGKILSQFIGFPPDPSGVREVVRITPTPIPNVLPASDTSYNFVPTYSGEYIFEMTCAFGGNGAVFDVEENAIAFNVSPGGDDDYGAAIAIARVIPSMSPNTPYTCTSLHTLTAGTTYTITLYVLTSGAGPTFAPVLGASGGFVIEATLVSPV